VPIFGSLMAQELVGRVAASRSEKVAQRSAFRAACIYFLVGLIPVLLGLIGVRYMPELQDSETLMPLLAKIHLNYFFYIIFVGALVSAILSTVDTTLLASSALLSHNLIYPSFPKMDEKRKVLVARFCTLFAGIVSYGIAFSSDSITGLVETASSLGGPTILVITIAALWDPIGKAFNALFAMAMSILTWFFCHFVVEVDFPVMMTVFVCTVCYVGSLPFVRYYPNEQKADVKFN
jgi:Na+/proline symporter